MCTSWPLVAGSTCTIQLDQARPSGDKRTKENEVRSKRKRSGLIHLNGHEGRVVANLLVDLVPLALRVESVRKTLSSVL